MRNTSAAVLCLLVLSSASLPAQSTVAQLADAGWQFVQKGDADKAAAAFREALTMHPRDAVLNLGAGVAAHLQGRVPKPYGFLPGSANPNLTHPANES